MIAKTPPLFFLIIMVLCTVPFTAHAAESKLPVFVSILPQKYFVEKIGGNLVEINVMVEPGSNPHTYEPKPAQMIKLASAKIFFAIGVNFEDIWLKKITAASPSLKIVHTESGIQKTAMAEEKTHNETEKNNGHHHNGELDPHIWLSPKLVMQQAATIKNALKEADQAHAAEYETGYTAFIEEIKLLDNELKKIFEKTDNRKFMVFHPSWGYFAEAYNLEQIPVEIEGKQTKPGQLEKLIKKSKQLGIKVIFAQPQFSSQVAEVLAKEINGRVIFVDPLAENWNENMKSVAASFKKELR